MKLNKKFSTLNYRKFSLGALLYGLLASQVLMPAFSAPPSVEKGNKGHAAFVDGLPPGIFRSQLKALPEQARARAVSWLQNETFPAADIAYLRADSHGQIFFEDPPAENIEPTTSESTATTGEITLANIFKLHSKPGASRTVHVDMDGQVVSDTVWNQNTANTLYMRPYDQDGDETTFNTQELQAMAEIWKRIAEDFSPFDIDVTTEPPASYGPNTGLILITFKADQYGNEIATCNCGGIAYVGVWGRSNYTYYQPALVFIDGVGTGPHNISEAASHELGHNLNLYHDGTSTSAYYQGHGSGNTQWAPIMGVGYWSQVTQWSKGEYSDANNHEDDLNIIQGHLGYSTDDHGDTSNATPLLRTGATSIVATTPVNDPGNLNRANKGVIEDRFDVDLFYIETGAGTIDLTVTPAWADAYVSQSSRGANLDIQVTLYNSAGGVVAQSSPSEETHARIYASVGADRYILAIEGVGQGTASTGYSDYGSLGQYFIAGTVPEDIKDTAPPPPAESVSAVLQGDNSILVSWVDPATSLDTEELGYRVHREIDGNGRYEMVADLPQGSESYLDTNLDSGSYTYKVEAYNTVGPNSWAGPTPAVDVSALIYVSSETTDFGSVVSGSYLSTNAQAGAEILQEERSRGKPARAYSRLQHTWTVPNIAAAATIQITGDAPLNNEGDDFRFSYSINDGPFVAFGVIENGTGVHTLSTALSVGGGKLEIRVEDTNRTRGLGNKDSVNIHYIAVSHSAGEQVPVVAISAPYDGYQVQVGEAIAFAATANDYEDGDLSGSISWSSDLESVFGHGAHVSYSGLRVGTHTITAASTDSAGNAGTQSISITVSDTGGLILGLTTYKAKGVKYVDLSWSTATTVDIYRNGAQVITTSGSTYTDRLGKGGGGQYVYQVCETGTTTCSNEVVATF